MIKYTAYTYSYVKGSQVVHGWLRMNGDEFIKKVLSGERNFEGIDLSDSNWDDGRIGCDLENHDGFEELQNYLKKQDFSKSYSIRLGGSNLKGLKASNLYLPYIEAPEVILTEAKLNGANFSNGFLPRLNAYGWDTDLSSVDFGRAYLSGANFTDANLNRANLGYADLRGTNFYRANLEGIRNLGHARNLETANFSNTTIPRKYVKLLKK